MHLLTVDASLRVREGQEDSVGNVFLCKKCVKIIQSGVSSENKYTSEDLI